jgi:hypothetical protein
MDRFLVGFAIIVIAIILVWTGILLVIKPSVQHYAAAETGNFLKISLNEELVEPPKPVTEFKDEFSSPQVLVETGSMSESEDPHWWVNSGGRFNITDGSGKTIQGDTMPDDPMAKLYARTNPLDTDNGVHPQNIFRLVERNKWTDFSQEVYFRITALNMSHSPNRNASNGVFLFNRYQSGDDLYYTGLRVDGAAVIKKKLRGKYYTMAYKPLFPGSDYDRDNNPERMPQNSWLGLKSEVKTNEDGTVSVKLFVDTKNSGTWDLFLSVTDTGTSTGAAIIKGGYAGLRTDFMDVEFKHYAITALEN